MMPGIIISFIFSEQLRLIFQTTPLKNQLAGAEEPADDTPNWLGIQIRTANLPGSPRGCLFPLQQTRLHQPFDGSVTDPTDPGSFLQTHLLRVG